MGHVARCVAMTMVVGSWMLAGCGRSDSAYDPRVDGIVLPVEASADMHILDDQKARYPAHTATPTAAPAAKPASAPAEAPASAPTPEVVPGPHGEAPGGGITPPG